MRPLIYTPAFTPLFLTQTTRLHPSLGTPTSITTIELSKASLERAEIPTEHSTSLSDTHLSPSTEAPGSKLFAAGSSLATRMSTDRKFHCTQIDKKGDIFMGHSNIQRSELVSKVSTTLYQTIEGKLKRYLQYGILARDLRKIDKSQLPAILVRQSTILVNFLHFRVLITHEDVLILHIFKPTQGETNHISAFMYEL